jgi:hypothetical protein
MATTYLTLSAKADIRNLKEIRVRFKHGGISAIFILVMLPVITKAQTKPRITSPSDRSTAYVDNQLNVTVLGNNVEVIYAGLIGNPNPYSDNESNFYKGTMYQSGNKFFFTPSSNWTNKWVKIIAHDKSSNLWSDPVYVQDRVFWTKGYERGVAVAFPMGNIVFFTHLANAETPYCPTHSKPMATAIRLLLADTRSSEGNRFCSEKWRKQRASHLDKIVPFAEIKTGTKRVFLNL